MHTNNLWLGLVGLVSLSLLAGCVTSAPPQVVLYTSVDQPYSEPILHSFESQTGVRVRTIYDTEATKTTGLVSRLMAERNRPQADVFWSSEIAQTLWLQEQRVLARYNSPATQNIPAAYRDPEGYWTGMGLRARILLVNTSLVPVGEYPDSIYDLLDPKWLPGEVGLANPLFGTSATHVAALYAALGPSKARAYFETLQDRGVRIVDGNSVVRDMVANGDLKVGITDTDDAYAAVSQGKPVKVIFPDQDQLGTLLIPNTIALIDKGPNPEQAKKLIDFLLNPQIEETLVQQGFLYSPVRSTSHNPNVIGMNVPWARVASQASQSKADMKEIFLK